MAQKICKRWDGCAGFQVTLLDESSRLFWLTRTQTAHGDVVRSRNVEFVKSCCSCEKWQDDDVPFIDGMAVFRIYEEQPLDFLVPKLICPWYRYKSHQKLFKHYIIPVVIDQLVRDGVTKPPMNNGKRQTGRPRVKRIRNRSKYKDP
jgi:hypothetical protein